MALMGRRINIFVELWCLVASGGLDIWVSWTSFQKSNISWPQQPPTGKVLKFNMIFHDSTKTKIVSKYQNKAEFKTLDDSEVLSSDFSGLTTSTASLTSSVSVTSLASPTSKALFHQITSWFWWLNHPWHQNDYYLSIFVEWIIKNPIFYWFYHLFCWRLLRPTDGTG